MRMRRALVLAGYLSGASALVASTWSGDAVAQSAADKATARQLASKGIKQYQAKDYASALENLQRAQSLYDAPVHLLYIARCQAELGQLVDAAETYRRLVRTDVNASTPAAFVKAVEDGDSELAALEPRIPLLTVEVVPTGIEGLEVTIDGKAFNTAALGVERPTNPGTRLVEAKAPGYLPAQREVTLSEGKSGSVSLTLEPDPHADTAEPVAVAETSEGVSAAGLSEGKNDKLGLGLVVGLRLGPAIMSGQLQQGDDAMIPARSTSDFVPVGGMAELNLGLRFLKNFSARLYFAAAAYSAGSELTEGDASNYVNQAEITTEASGSSIGFGFTGGSNPREFGGFGEAVLLFSQDVEWTQTFNNLDAMSGCGSSSYTRTESYSGAGIRLGGGLNVPLGDVVTLAPMISFTLAAPSTYRNSVSPDDGCLINPRGTGEVDLADDSSFYYQTFLGLAAGDFNFGDDWF